LIIIQDGTLVLLAEPIAIFDTVSAPESAVFNLFGGNECKVVPLENDTFAAVFSTPEHVPEPIDGPGVWITYIKYVEVVE
jgi:hypothetical protein